MRSMMPACLEVDDSTNRLAFMHQIEGFVDALQRQAVRNEGIEADLAAHRLLHHAWQLAAPLYATESAAAPHATRNELKRTRVDFLARAGHANDHAFAPALVAALQRRAHHVHVADAFEAVI